VPIAFERYRPSKLDRPASVEVPANAQRDFVAAAAESLKLARDLINTPASDMGPADLAAAARQMRSVITPSIGNGWVRTFWPLDFPAIHAVGRASASAPRLIDIQWSPPGGENLPRLTLVGKGVCFDSGGWTSSRVRHGPDEEGYGRCGCGLGAGEHADARRIRARLRVLIPRSKTRSAAMRIGPATCWRPGRA